MNGRKKRRSRRCMGSMVDRTRRPCLGLGRARVWNHYGTIGYLCRACHKIDAPSMKGPG